mmetsp:Transcript_30359/g.100757  ORF Transcript_30359/g.100757 Transcript_30359/m.100757 type:complete len:211 (-) Transcript_30359:587-1219(-)
MRRPSQHILSPHCAKAVRTRRCSSRALQGSMLLNVAYLVWNLGITIIIHCSAALHLRGKPVAALASVWSSSLCQITQPHHRHGNCHHHHWVPSPSKCKGNPSLWSLRYCPNTPCNWRAHRSHQNLHARLSATRSRPLRAVAGRSAARARCRSPDRPSTSGRDSPGSPAPAPWPGSGSGPMRRPRSRRRAGGAAPKGSSTTPARRRRQMKD